MNDTVDIEAALKNESIETLMLVSVFGEEPYRHQARKEIQRHQLVNCLEPSWDGFETNLGMIF